MQNDQSTRIRVHTRMPFGNAGQVRVQMQDVPEVCFSVEPRGSLPLWFCMRILPPDVPLEDSRFRLVLENYENLAGGVSPVECVPVVMPEGQWWSRLAPGKPELTPDGRLNAVWQFNALKEPLNVALCFPYGMEQLRQLDEKSKIKWNLSAVGLSAGGHRVVRLANAWEGGGPISGGLYLVARLRGSEMPGSWVLDGLLQRLTTAKHNPYLTWSAPLADPDALLSGATASVPDLQHAWMDHSPSPEINVLAADIRRWASRCHPSLGIEFCAAALRETGGITCSLPSAGQEPEAHKHALKWAHVIEQRLGREYAAADFVRADEPAHPPRAAFHDWMARNLSCPALRLHIPWATAGESLFSQKIYRDAGRRIADALLEKRKQAG